MKTKKIIYLIIIFLIILVFKKKGAKKNKIKLEKKNKRKLEKFSNTNKQISLNISIDYKDGATAKNIKKEIKNHALKEYIPFIKREHRFQYDKNPEILFPLPIYAIDDITSIKLTISAPYSSTTNDLYLDFRVKNSPWYSKKLNNSTVVDITSISEMQGLINKDSSKPRTNLYPFYMEFRTTERIKGTKKKLLSERTCTGTQTQGCSHYNGKGFMVVFIPPRSQIDYEQNAYYNYTMPTEDEVKLYFPDIYDDSLGVKLKYSGINQYTGKVTEKRKTFTRAPYPHWKQLCSKNEDCYSNDCNTQYKLCRSRRIPNYKLMGDTICLYNPDKPADFDQCRVEFGMLTDKYPNNHYQDICTRNYTGTTWHTDKAICSAVRVTDNYDSISKDWMQHHGDMTLKDLNFLYLRGITDYGNYTDKFTQAAYDFINLNTSFQNKKITDSNLSSGLYVANSDGKKYRAIVVEDIIFHRIAHNWESSDFNGYVDTYDQAESTRLGAPKLENNFIIPKFIKKAYNETLKLKNKTDEYKALNAIFGTLEVFGPDTIIAIMFPAVGFTLKIALKVLRKFGKLVDAINDLRTLGKVIKATTKPADKVKSLDNAVGKKLKSKEKLNNLNQKTSLSARDIDFEIDMKKKPRNSWSSTDPKDINLVVKDKEEVKKISEIDSSINESVSKKKRAKRRRRAPRNVGPARNHERHFLKRALSAQSRWHAKLEVAMETSRKIYGYMSLSNGWANNFISRMLPNMSSTENMFLLIKRDCYYSTPSSSQGLHTLDITFGNSRTAVQSAKNRGVRRLNTAQRKAEYMNFANRYPGAKKGYRIVYNQIVSQSNMMNLKEYIYKTCKPRFDKAGEIIPLNKVKDDETLRYLNSFSVGDLMDVIRKDKNIKFDQSDFTDFLYISTMGSLYQTRGLVRRSGRFDGLWNFLAKWKKTKTISFALAFDMDIWPLLSHQFEKTFKAYPNFKRAMRALSIFLETTGKFLVFGSFPERYVQKAFKTHRCMLTYNKAFTMRKQSLKDITEDAFDILVENPLRQVMAGLTRTVASKFKKTLVYMAQPETKKKSKTQVERELLNIFSESLYDATNTEKWNAILRKGYALNIEDSVQETEYDADNTIQLESFSQTSEVATLKTKFKAEFTKFKAQTLTKDTDFGPINKLIKQLILIGFYDIDNLIKLTKDVSKLKLRDFVFLFDSVHVNQRIKLGNYIHDMLKSTTIAELRKHWDNLKYMFIDSYKIVEVIDFQIKYDLFFRENGDLKPIFDLLVGKKITKHNHLSSENESNFGNTGSQSSKIDKKIGYLHNKYGYKYTETDNNDTKAAEEVHYGMKEFIFIRSSNLYDNSEVFESLEENDNKKTIQDKILKDSDDRPVISKNTLNPGIEKNSEYLVKIPVFYSDILKEICSIIINLYKTYKHNKTEYDQIKNSVIEIKDTLNDSNYDYDDVTKDIYNTFIKDKSAVTLLNKYLEYIDTYELETIVTIATILHENIETVQEVTTNDDEEILEPFASTTVKEFGSSHDIFTFYENLEKNSTIKNKAKIEEFIKKYYEKRNEYTLNYGLYIQRVKGVDTLEMDYIRDLDRIDAHKKNMYGIIYTIRRAKDNYFLRNDSPPYSKLEFTEKFNPKFNTFIIEPEGEKIGIKSTSRYTRETYDTFGWDLLSIVTLDPITPLWEGIKKRQGIGLKNTELQWLKNDKKNYDRINFMPSYLSSSNRNLSYKSNRGHENSWDVLSANYQDRDFDMIIQIITDEYLMKDSNERATFENSLNDKGIQKYLENLSPDLEFDDDKSDTTDLLKKFLFTSQITAIKFYIEKYGILYDKIKSDYDYTVTCSADSKAQHASCAAAFGTFGGHPVGGKCDFASIDGKNHFWCIGGKDYGDFCPWFEDAVGGSDPCGTLIEHDGTTKVKSACVLYADFNAANVCRYIPNSKKSGQRCGKPEECAGHFTKGITCCGSDDELKKGMGTCMKGLYDHAANAATTATVCPKKCVGCAAGALGTCSFKEGDQKDVDGACCFDNQCKADAICIENKCKAPLGDYSLTKVAQVGCTPKEAGQNKDILKGPDYLNLDTSTSGKIANQSYDKVRKAADKMNRTGGGYACKSGYSCAGRCYPSAWVWGNPEHYKTATGNVTGQSADGPYKAGAKCAVVASVTKEDKHRHCKKGLDCIKTTSQNERDQGKADVGTAIYNLFSDRDMESGNKKPPEQDAADKAAAAKQIGEAITASDYDMWKCVGPGSLNDGDSNNSPQVGCGDNFGYADKCRSKWSCGGICRKKSGQKPNTTIKDSSSIKGSCSLDAHCVTNRCVNENCQPLLDDGKPTGVGQVGCGDNETGGAWKCKSRWSCGGTCRKRPWHVANSQTWTGTDSSGWCSLNEHCGGHGTNTTWRCCDKNTCRKDVTGFLGFQWCSGDPLNEWLCSNTGTKGIHDFINGGACNT